MPWRRAHRSTDTEPLATIEAEIAALDAAATDVASTGHRG